MVEETSDESLVQKLADVERLLDEYETRIHLDKVKIIDVDLNLSKEMFMSMHYDDLKGLLWEYGQYSLALQKEINRHNARYNWAEANLKRYLEKESPDFPGWKWEERMANALSGSEYAQRLNRLKIQSKMVIDRLSFLPSKVQFLSEIIKDELKTKRYKQNDAEYNN